MTPLQQPPKPPLTRRAIGRGLAYVAIVVGSWGVVFAVIALLRLMVAGRVL